MLKANKKTLIIASIITVLPILIGIMLWNRLPDPMAIIPCIYSFRLHTSKGL